MQILRNTMFLLPTAAAAKHVSEPQRKRHAHRSGSDPGYWVSSTAVAPPGRPVYAPSVAFGSACSMPTNSPVTVTFWPLPVTPVITNQANPTTRTFIEPPVQLVLPSWFSMIGIGTSCGELGSITVAVPLGPTVTIWLAGLKTPIRSAIPCWVGPGIDPDCSPRISPTLSGHASVVPLISCR